MAQRPGTLLIDFFSGSIDDVTNNGRYDFLILSEAIGIKTAGQIISVDSEILRTPYNSDLESYCLTVKGKNSDAKLTVSGNYWKKEDAGTIVLTSGNNLDDDTKYLFQDKNVPFSLEYEKNYNLYHLQFNNNDDGGAVKFAGANNRLILTAQAGAELANIYHNSSESQSADNLDVFKTDDYIRIGSSAYGMYPLAEAQNRYNPHSFPVPNTNTAAFTLNAMNTLTVVSDLAGMIEADAAVFVRGYRTYSAKEGWKLYNSASNHSVKAAGIKADKLVLEANFRANIKTWNNAESFAKAEAGSVAIADIDSVSMKWDEKVSGYISQPDGGTPLVINGTSIVAGQGVDGNCAASNNIIATYGILTETDLTTKENSIWAGTISVETSDTNIVASSKYFETGWICTNPQQITKAIATGNKIEAFGLKSNGSITIHEMGSLTPDDRTNNGEDDAGNPIAGSITVSLNNNKVLAESVKHPKDADIAVSTTASATMTAAAVHAQNLTLGKVASDVKFTVNANNNQMIAKSDGTTSASYLLDIYGLYAASKMDLTNFDGQITINGDGNDIRIASSEVADIGSSLSFTGISADTLKSNTNLCGEITVKATGKKVGIHAPSLTVYGVIDTLLGSRDYELTTGIETGTITASGFSGTIYAGLGISASRFESNISGATFNVNGEIYAETGIKSSGKLNIMVSGKIDSGNGYAILVAEREEKFNDFVELTDSAQIIGNIDLGAGKNEIYINSSARLQGSLLAANGELDILFVLSGEAGEDAVIRTAVESFYDKVLMDSATITVKCDAGVNGTYKLLEYDFDAREYFRDREIAIAFMDQTVTLRSDADLSGEAVIVGSDGSRITVETQLVYEGGKSTLQISVDGLPENEYLVQTPEYNPAQKESERTLPWVTEEYNKTAETLTIKWAWDEALSNFDKIAITEVEYWLYDENGEKLGNSLFARVTGNTLKINGVGNNTRVDYRIRLWGDEDGNTVTDWGEIRTVDRNDLTFVDTGAWGFEEGKITTDVQDPFPRENTKRVTGAIAELSWSSMESVNPIRNYEIEYCTLNEELHFDVIADILGGEENFTTVKDFFANNLFTEEALKKLGTNSYTKTVTGTEVALSNLQNLSFVYWRVRAVDAAGNKSDWVSGKTFRVYLYGDTTAPTFHDQEDEMSAAVQYTFPAKSVTSAAEKSYSVVLAWDQAVDTGSGVRAYNITLTGATSKLTIEVEAEAMLPHHFAQWQIDDTAAFDQDLEYRVVINVDGNTNILDAEMRYDGDAVLLTWNTNKSNISGQNVTIQKSVNGEWVDVKSLRAQDYTLNTFDYSYQVSDLIDKDYKVTIHAVDYFNNETQVPITNSVKADSMVPVFTKDDAARIEGKIDINIPEAEASPEKLIAKLQERVTLKGTLVWNDASDAQSGIRSYLVSLNATDSSENVNVVCHVATPEGNNGELVTEISISGLVAGQTYIFDTQTIVADEQGKLVYTARGNQLNTTLNFTGVSEEETNTEHQFEVTGANAKLHIYLEDICNTELFLTDLTPGATYTCDGKSFTADTKGNAILVIDGNMIDRKITYRDEKQRGFEVAVNRTNAKLLYTLDIGQLGLRAPEYDYSICAQDYFGQKSASLSDTFGYVDNGAPTFISDKPQIKIVTNNTDPENPTIIPTVTWEAAQDQDGDLGVRYYTFSYRVQGSDEWSTPEIIPHDNSTNTYSWTYSGATSMALQFYDFKIVAVDYFGRTDEITGTFGRTECDGPVGNFVSFDKKLVSNYQVTTEEKPVLDAEGKEKTDEEGKVITQTVITGKVLTDASVTLSWKDNFTDDSGVLYRVTVSGNSNLDPNHETTYTFWTTEPGVKEMVFDNTTTGRPVSVFEKMKTVYWAVEAYDAQYNASSSPRSPIQSFEFKNEFGSYITLDSKLSQPDALILDDSDMKNGVHTGVYGLAWQTPSTPTGIYMYTVTLYDAKGKKLYSASTLDKSDMLNGNYAATDLSNKVSVNGDVLSISDLRRFFAVKQLADGNYKISVTAHDAAGRSAESQKIDFAVDTTRPERVVFSGYSVHSSNVDSKRFCNIVLRWEEAKDASGIKHYVVQYRLKDQASWTSRIVESGTEFILEGIPEENTTAYEFNIYAVDNQNNVGFQWAEEDRVVVNPVFDRYGDSITPDEATDITGLFQHNLLTVSDTVGQGDVADTFTIKTEQSMALSLTVSELEAVIGNNKTLKIDIYEKSNPGKVWKSFTVKSTGRLFSDLLLDSNSTYTFKVANTASDKNVSSYRFDLEKTPLSSNNNDDVIDRAGTFALGDNWSDWVGVGDEIDYRIITLEESGKYTLELSGAALSTKLTVYEILANGRLKSLGTITAGAAQFYGISTKELLLDKNKKYAVEVKSSKNATLGTDYKVEMKEIETYEAATTADDVRSIAKESSTPDLTKTQTGWVGFGDASDFYRLAVGSSGGVGDFTITRAEGSDGALTLVVYELLAADVNGVGYKFRTVKSVKLASNATSISTGNLFLKGDKGGTYFIEVTAPGAAKTENAGYTIESETYKIGDKLAEPDTGINKLDEDALSIEAVSEASGWVGIGDTNDCYKLDITDAGNYTFSFDGINGKEFTAAVCYYDAAKKKFVNLVTMNGAAGADSMMLSREFTIEELSAANQKFFLQVSAKGKDANSEYSFTVTETDGADDNNSSSKAETLALNVKGEGWVGTGDVVDFYRVDAGASGICDINVSGVANPVKITVYEGTTKALGTLSLTASKNSGSLSGLIFDSSKEYYIEVSATGAAKGQSSNYNVELITRNKGALEKDQTVSGKITPAENIDSYTLSIDETGFYSFALANVDNNAVKFSLIDLATGKAVATLAAGAKSDHAALTYEFTQAGKYLVKLESSSKNKGSDYELTLIDRKDEIETKDDAISKEMSSMLSTNMTFGGWVGKGDSIDYAEIDLSSSGTGIYDLSFVVADNSAKLTVYSEINGALKVVKTVSATQAKAGVLNGLLLDANNKYYVAVQAGNTNGTKDSDYSVSLKQTLVSETGVVNDKLDAGYESSNWVGFGNAVNTYTYSYTAESDEGVDIAEFSFALADVTQDNVTVTIYADDKKLQSFTLSAKSVSAAYSLALTNKTVYRVEVTSPNAAKGAASRYMVSFDQWNTANYVTSNNDPAKAVSFAVGSKYESAVWQNGTASFDNVDFLAVDLDADGSYMLDLAGITGNISLSIGTLDANGNFKQLQKVTAKAGTDALTLARNLTAGSYYIKLESSAKNSASRYELTMTNNNLRVNSEGDKTFSAADDSWKLVAGDVKAKRYSKGDTLDNWVGFGDAVDVFKVRFDENGLLTFNGADAATLEALRSKEITLTLADYAGKSVVLTFDAELGEYVSKNVLLANTDYYLQIKSANSKTGDTAYQIAIN